MNVDESTAVRFGRFVALQSLGAGGMATVYLAFARDSGRQSLVAIKQSHPSVSRSTQWDEARKEVYCASSIDHKNVVRVFEVGDGAQGPYIVMEYIEGASVFGLLTERGKGKVMDALPPAVVARIIADSLRGLHAAHDARDASGTPLGLVHRDVSPQNLLVGVDGVTRLADFGIARLLQSSSTAPGAFRGKSGYVSPEQILGQPADRRADIFSMGVVMWECLAGKRLFHGTSRDSSFKLAMSDSQPSLAEAIPSMPTFLVQACEGALQKNPNDRPGTALELAERIEHEGRSAACLASHSEVAEVLRARLADKLERRKRLVEEWCERAAELDTILARDDHELSSVGARRVLDNVGPSVSARRVGGESVTPTPQPKAQREGVADVADRAGVGAPVGRRPFYVLVCVLVVLAWCFGYLCSRVGR